MMYEEFEGIMYRPLYPTTNIFCKKDTREQGIKYTLRMGFTFPGFDIPTVSNNPFDPDFRGNYLQATAYNFDVAMDILKKEIKETAEIYYV